MHIFYLPIGWVGTKSTVIAAIYCPTVPALDDIWWTLEQLMK
jgi:hypothetical protein